MTLAYESTIPSISGRPQHLHDTILECLSAHSEPSADPKPPGTAIVLADQLGADVACANGP